MRANRAKPRLTDALFVAAFLPLAIASMDGGG
jgi:hypothetical protein